MKLTIGVGRRVKHPKYGLGTITHAWLARRNPNFAVKFDKGGPQGFAVRATNNAEDLKPV